MSEIFWTIKNVNYASHETGRTIESPKFKFQDAEWTLHLYPRGWVDSDYLSMKLCRTSRNQELFNESASQVEVEFSCLTTDTSIRHNRLVSEDLTNSLTDRYCLFREPRFLQRHEVFGRKKALYLLEDSLTLRCRIWKDDADSDEFVKSFGCTCLEVEQLFLRKTLHLNNSLWHNFSLESKLQKKDLISVGLLDRDGIIHVDIDTSRLKNPSFSFCKLSLEDEITGKEIFNHTCLFGRTDRHRMQFPFSDEMSHAENNPEKEYLFTAIVEYSTGKEKKTIEKDCPLKVSTFLSDFSDWRNMLFKNISDKLWRLYFAQECCDVELRVENKPIFAHRFVLCARSPVFLAMMTATMKEKENGIIKIVDLSFDTLTRFISFIYLDSVEILRWDQAIELYCAADKYQVHRLKILCRVYFLQKISLDYLCELLMLADTYHDFILERKVNVLIWEHAGEVFTSAIWSKFKIEQPELAVRTFSSKYEEKENKMAEGLYEQQLTNHPKFQDDFKTLYEGRVFGNIVIRTQSASFYVDKSILCASSETFKDLLSNDFTYKSTEYIQIEGFENEIVSKMLLHLHTDSFEDIQWDTAKKLYRAAMIYKLQRLKFKCSCYLVENLRASNACDLLLFAQDQLDSKMKSVVIDYINLCDEEVFGSDEWKHLCKTNSSLACETMLERY